MMTSRYFFQDIREQLAFELHRAEYIGIGRWQSQDVSHKPEMDVKEVRHVNYSFQVPTTAGELQSLVQPNLPWAEDHFQERVSGQPLNPPPSESWWPFAVQGNQLHKEGERFSHTYPERFWPKRANIPGGHTGFVHYGIRYQYGDLANVVDLLIKDESTRQAYLPIWFPEDTGAVEGQRVPCSLGYHFMIRGSRLDCTYVMRSCDYLRHWVDDVYMAARLMQWVCDKIRTVDHLVRPGHLVMQIASLHVFRGDEGKMTDITRQILKSRDDEKTRRLLGAF